MAFVMHFLPAALMAPVRDDHIEIAPRAADGAAV